MTTLPCSQWVVKQRVKAGLPVEGIRRKSVEKDDGLDSDMDSEYAPSDSDGGYDSEEM
eukprot:SAG31_NODE_728_length_12522_cov_13.320534_4_plen_58_part_00